MSQPSVLEAGRCELPDAMPFPVCAFLACHLTQAVSVRDFQPQIPTSSYCDALHVNSSDTVSLLLLSWSYFPVLIPPQAVRTVNKQHGRTARSLIARSANSESAETCLAMGYEQRYYRADSGRKDDGCVAPWPRGVRAGTAGTRAECGGFGE